MIRDISLSFFNVPPTRKYHIYRISGSEASQTPHSHSYYQICYVDRGEIKHCQGNNEVPLVFGDAFIIPPGFVHRISYPDAGALIYSLSFEENLFHPGFCYSNVYQFMTALKLDTAGDKQISVRMKITLSENERHTLKALLDLLIRESETKCPPALSASGSLIAAAMCVLAQAYFQGEERGTSLDNLNYYNQSIAECLEYIDSHFTQPLTLDDLARRFAISKTTFSLMFQRITGVTLKRYITQKRIEYAAMLASSSALSLNEIADMAGYEYFSTFYRNFTKITGVSPSKYRSSCNG